MYPWPRMIFVSWLQLLILILLAPPTSNEWLKIMKCFLVFVFVFYFSYITSVEYTIKVKVCQSKSYSIRLHSTLTTMTISRHSKKFADKWLQHWIVAYLTPKWKSQNAFQKQHVWKHPWPGKFLSNTFWPYKQHEVKNIFFCNNMWSLWNINIMSFPILCQVKKCH